MGLTGRRMGDPSLAFILRPRRWSLVIAAIWSVVAFMLLYAGSGRRGRRAASTPARSSERSRSTRYAAGPSTMPQCEQLRRDWSPKIAPRLGDWLSTSAATRGCGTAGRAGPVNAGAARPSTPTAAAVTSLGRPEQRGRASVIRAVRQLAAKPIPRRRREAAAEVRRPRTSASASSWMAPTVSMRCVCSTARLIRNGGRG
jgi:hypothetical protein